MMDGMGKRKKSACEQLHLFTMMKTRCGVRQSLWKCWFCLQNEIKTRRGDSKNEVGPMSCECCVYFFMICWVSWLRFLMSSNPMSLLILLNFSIMSELFFFLCHLKYHHFFKISWLCHLSFYGFWWYLKYLCHRLVL